MQFTVEQRHLLDGDEQREARKEPGMLRQRRTISRFGYFRFAPPSSRSEAYPRRRVRSLPDASSARSRSVAPFRL
jgi:hypothetical protein